MKLGEIIFKGQTYLWDMITYGWVAEILLVLSCFFALITLFYIFKEWRIISFIVWDLTLFLLFFGTDFIKEKKYFVKNMSYILLTDTNWLKVLPIIIGVTIIMGIVIYIVFTMGNERFINT